jgi:hypothetical protein
MKPKPNRRSLPVDCDYEAGLQNRSSRKSDDAFGNCELPSNHRKTNLEESQINHYYYVNMENLTESNIEANSTDEKTDDTEGKESIVEETTEAIARNKTLVLGVLVFVLALFGMGILSKSSCGGSLSFKLFPPELQLNSNSCVQVEQTPQQTVGKK